jgi:hypothetical protein
MPEVLVERGQLHIRVPCDFRNYSIYLPTSLLQGPACPTFRNLARYLLNLIAKILMLCTVNFLHIVLKSALYLSNFFFKFCRNYYVFYSTETRHF